MTDTNYTHKNEAVKWSAITHDWNHLQTYDDTIARCYQLTDRQAAILLELSEYISWKNRFANLPIEPQSLFNLKNRTIAALMNDTSCEVKDCADYGPLWGIFNYIPNWPTEPIGPDNLSPGWNYSDGVAWAQTTFPSQTPEVYFHLAPGQSAFINMNTVLFGGLAMVLENGNILTAQYIDLEAQPLAIPPVFPGQVVHEVQTAQTARTITVRFVPKLDAELLPIGFGGVRVNTDENDCNHKL